MNILWIIIHIKMQYHKLQLKSKTYESHAVAD